MTSKNKPNYIYRIKCSECGGTEGIFVETQTPHEEIEGHIECRECQNFIDVLFV